MNSFDNRLMLHYELKGARVPVPLSRLCEALECSEPTVHRVIAQMRNRYNAPIKYHRQHPSGYLYSNDAFELPMSVWLKPEQVLALMSTQQLLKSFQPGLLDPMVDPMLEMLSQMMETQGITPDLGNRIRLLRSAARDPGPCFNLVATALVERKRLHIEYEALGTGEISRRDVSPQRLIHYRDNWFLDAWCHLRNELRIFSIDCIREANVLREAADEIADDVMDRELGTSYGLFSGQPTAVARLRFTLQRARRVCRETWHPKQQGRFLASGEYELEIPFHRSEELVQDILRHGPEVEVMEPLALRQQVVERLREALARYS